MPKVTGRSTPSQDYRSALNLHDTQIGIKTVKDFFQVQLAERLHLLRVSAPLFVEPSSVPLIHIDGVDIICLLVPADGAHVGVKPFAMGKAVFAESHGNI